MGYNMPKASRKDGSKGPDTPERSPKSNPHDGSLTSATFPDYQPSKRPTQRMGLLRDIYKKRFGEEFDPATMLRRFLSSQHQASEKFPLQYSEVRFPISQREVRRVVKEMFSFEPLVKPSSAQLSLMKDWALNNVGRFMQDNREYAFKNGHSSVQLYSTRDKPPQKVDLLDVFSNGEFYYRANNLTPPYLSGGLDRYRKEHRVPVDDIIRRLSTQKTKLQMLDLGSMTSQMLSEVKDIFKDKIVTHGLSPFHCPQYKVDHFHCLYGEYLPKSFANKFDLIVSQRALEYSMFPDLILENIVQSLAPGGEAYIDWRPGRFMLQYHSPKLVPKYLDCVNAKMRSVNENYICLKAEHNENPVEISCGELLWYHKVKELQRLPGLTVLNYQDQPLGLNPKTLKIRKDP